MAFEGDEEQLSSKREELASLDGRNKVIVERLQSEKCSFDLFQVYIHNGQAGKLLDRIGNHIRDFCIAHVYIAYSPIQSEESGNEQTKNQRRLDSAQQSVMGNVRLIARAAKFTR